MLIIPAIDIKDGKCVRLTRGDFNQQKIYLDKPLDMAIIWRKQNAKMLHVVDLDAALSGEPVNFVRIKEIVEALDIPIQVGGGIRSVEAVKRYLDIGVSRVVIGSAAVTNPELVAELMTLYRSSRIVVGIDADNGIPKIKGWTESGSMQDYELALEMKKMGVERIIYTDISRDGMMQGFGYESTKRFAEKAGMKITASGGVTSSEDLKRLIELQQYGVDSVIIGKALYECNFPCQEIWYNYEEGICLDRNFSTARTR
ncbi:MAG: 1-(5-phosphoribosyl)-5-[(5-phosphoribosylamino)methylideneamino]imidazole-4-carboxamide isomerase [Chlorobium sp.]|jgi:phosphoribosylformimino-5-aminoimidazole carboxamide ribotide isomerase|uniref:1-(5-phosphoribosyl)-5-[(5- phosphoribosylamino)methylideneamino]imidazole-4- carboxamide isomerase n=1 Tax=Chlorobium sp. TaxID=1095 RepID=UPI001D3C66EA|nr:1-(5-phosphoribosyl)-5-[(5-phosphoribosylamino)methylideneamino]imidazole-4-carboxamide isomerase [Chlorobium sp.]MBN1278807.1 1-(5-phosphoribosyl)-5-[(5-phosphoribosylamino)methylideneamino]imidazole-4-carboxamide isomerase [Chlorobiaceae bacterium]MCF8216457.1 1-(5-phosphoribosyl)-5-[(5-phosphoribosylamino)methylideneamino]imidazole-4-carboxamide isomerase [Chlorobium sp.]MCF8271377.1 1-(5-phosphoribosyl)-5-[(5-phosphoribosylamino)methylideneamino]imidazole-4-carboxamide isomerase [Chlorobi